MGSSGSKTAQNAARRFPTRAPGSAPPPTATRTPRPSPRPQAQPQASHAEEDVSTGSVDAYSGTDSVNRAFADRLKQMGVAQPNPIFSPSSTVSGFPDAYPTAQSFSKPQFPPAVGNATLGVLAARRRIQEQADLELENMGRPGAQGRELLDIATVKKILIMRQRGDETADIELKLRLKPGVVARLGPLGIVAPT